MKFVSWNVNGLRARLKKDFMPTFKKLDADIFAVQEIKMQADEAILELDGYKERLFGHGDFLPLRTARRLVWYRRRRI